jgi:hypothetical protein
MEIIFEAENIASQVKRADLAATVRQKLVAPNRAFNHLTVLAENFSELWRSIGRAKVKPACVFRCLATIWP